MASTPRGAEHILQNNLEIAKEFVVFMKEQEDNSVT